MLKAAPYQTDFSAFILDPAGVITESGTTRRTIAVFRRTARVGIGALLGVLVTRILGAVVGRAAQIVLRNS